MKLYTEEQVKNFLKERTFMTEDAIDKLCAPLIPIELPSDEEIYELMDNLPFSKHIGEESFNYGKQKGFELGIKYIRHQIINQN